MKKLLLAFILTGLTFYFNNAAAQALQVAPGDTFTYTAPLDSLTQVYPELNGYVTNKSGQPDTLVWKFLNANIDSLWLGMSCCDPQNCYYIYPGPSYSAALHYFAADTGVGMRFQFNSSPACVADSGMFQILVWLKHDSIASAKTITYKSLFTGACVTAAITKVAATEIKIYPTPVNTQLTIEGLSSVNNPSVYIYDMLGNAVMHKEFTPAQNLLYINTSALHAGVYMVRIESDGARVITRRIEKFD